MIHPPKKDESHRQQKWPPRFRFWAGCFRAFPNRKNLSTFSGNAIIFEQNTLRQTRGGSNRIASDEFGTVKLDLNGGQNGFRAFFALLFAGGFHADHQWRGYGLTIGYGHKVTGKQIGANLGFAPHQHNTSGDQGKSLHFNVSCKNHPMIEMLHVVEMLHGDKDLSNGHGAAITALKLGAATPKAHRGSVNDAMMRAARAHELFIAANCITQGGNCQSAALTGKYSPNLNPIEHKWTQAKSIRRKTGQTTDQIFKQQL